jgi:hypothetical protein
LAGFSTLGYVTLDKKKELPNLMDEFSQNDATNTYAKRFIEAFSRIDLNARAQEIGVGQKDYKSFVKAYKAALRHFERTFCNRPIPPRQKSLRHLRRIEKAAETLWNELDQVYDEADKVWPFLQDAYMINETQDMANQLTGEYEGLSFAEYECETLMAATKRLMEMLAETRDEFPKTPRGKPKKNEAIEELVRQLAVIYELHTQKAAGKGCYHNGATDRYEGKFIAFVENSLVHFPQRPPLTNNAIGEIIRRALGLR